ncbi:hypothetical protein TH61_05570 [Rufibacter sp. DG15C]|uniref:hypothetical protein n=1 Tax=Rufibacter sp. DG15C TaxID=1379909 RepID=UPI00078B3A57|nr:hypothetical protein [Rufibacter sp. DG15C]AMM50753.1 hypothetical protein TH61_05570 [Rufibacter sp. DG15C]
MQEQTKEAAELYGLPITLRVPAELKRKLSDEAAALGVSLAQHGAGILAGAHQASESVSTQLDLALRENRALGQRLAVLEKQSAWQEGDAGSVLDTLRRNFAVLAEAHEKREAVTQDALRARGFDFNFNTNIAFLDGAQYFCVFGLGYRLEGKKMTIREFKS